jgi:hypothetical protein
MKTKVEIEEKANEAAEALDECMDNQTNGVLLALQWVLYEDAVDPLID